MPKKKQSDLVKKVEAFNEQSSKIIDNFLQPRGHDLFSLSAALYYTQIMFMMTQANKLAKETKLYPEIFAEGSEEKALHNFITNRALLRKTLRLL